MPASTMEIERLTKAVEGAKMITRLIDERMALKLSKVDGIVHEGVYFEQNVIPLIQTNLKTGLTMHKTEESTGYILAITRDGAPDQSFILFHFCNITAPRGMTWIADPEPLTVAQAAHFITSEELITVIQTKVQNQTVKYREKINNLRRVGAMLEWLRTGDPAQFN